MPETAWDIARVEAQAKRWQEMASVLPNDSERVAWLIEHVSFLSASHLQLQEAYGVNVGSVIRANQQADLTQETAKVAVAGLSQLLEAVEGAQP